MLALAPSHLPCQPPSVVHPTPLRPHTSAATSETYTLPGHRPPPRKLQSAFALPTYAAASSSHSSVPPTPTSQDSPGPSARRPVAPPTPPSQPGPPSFRCEQLEHEEEDPQTPPASDSEDNDDEVVPPESSDIDVNDYDSETLLGMLASTLSRIAKLNSVPPANTYMSTPLRPPHSSDSEHHGPIWRTLTTASRESLARSPSLTFHARQIPTIALDSYLQRIQKYCPASNEVFISLLVYLDRMTRLARDACGEIIPIDFYNIHRLIIAGITVASKFFSDVFYTNSRYAKVGGLPLAELNVLELQFLLLNDFHLTISPEEMQYYTKMVDLQSKIGDDISLTPFLPSTLSPMIPDTYIPVGPTEYFAAVSAYFAHQQALAHPQRAFHRLNGQSELPLFCPAMDYHLSKRQSMASLDTTSETEPEVETDVECYTDDEPTIRAPHSSSESSSETTSLHSSTSGDTDSIFTDDEDRSSDEPDVRLFDGRHSRQGGTTQL
ncbi:cyclin-domain-containing protein [Sparassis latifolia]|uniref:Cyclin-domain-containing protein n=1 Tax=Sparassis crispa TaxID=139825 RepID=A0A401GAE2_9APHY|nr:cyclin-domain-containing protein [Sparassis crispa]GBE79121.1 cyclin-domain-containing protein [Sparassis crispa]